MNERKCYECERLFRDDNHLALHIGRHQRLATGHATDSDRETLRRQQDEDTVADLQDLLHELDQTRPTTNITT